MIKEQYELIEFFTKEGLPEVYAYMCVEEMYNPAVWAPHFVKQISYHKYETHALFSALIYWDNSQYGREFWEGLYFELRDKVLENVRISRCK